MQWKSFYRLWWNINFIKRNLVIWWSLELSDKLDLFECKTIFPKIKTKGMNFQNFSDTVPYLLRETKNNQKCIYCMILNAKVIFITFALKIVKWNLWTQPVIHCSPYETESLFSLVSSPFCATNNLSFKVWCNYTLHWTVVCPSLHSFCILACIHLT